jgi:hypothetical protein
MDRKNLLKAQAISLGSLIFLVSRFISVILSVA